MCQQPVFANPLLVDGLEDRMDRVGQVGNRVMAAVRVIHALLTWMAQRDDKCEGKISDRRSLAPVVVLNLSRWCHTWTCTTTLLYRAPSSLTISHAAALVHK